jgi:hypothetical protein
MLLKSMKYQIKRTLKRIGITAAVLGGLSAICLLGPKETPEDRIRFLGQEPNGSYRVAVLRGGYVDELQFDKEGNLNAKPNHLTWDSPVYDAALRSETMEHARKVACQDFPLGTPFVRMHEAAKQYQEAQSSPFAVPHKD